MFSANKNSKKKLLYAVLCVALIIILQMFGFDNLILRKTSTVIKTFLLLWLVIIWSVELQKRLITRQEKNVFLNISILMIILVLIKFIKYNFYENEFISRILWYLYYVPFIFIPLFVFYSTYLMKEEKVNHPKLFTFLFVYSVVLCLGIATNDLHHLAFYDYQVINDSDVYKRGILYIMAVATILIYTFFTIFNCIKNSSKKVSKYWIQIIWVVLSIAFSLVYYFFLDGIFLPIADFMIIVFMGFIELSIQANLYPCNVLYPEIFSNSSINAIIENDNNEVIYKSKEYKEISPASQQFVEKNGTTLIDDELVHFEKIRNGKIFWSDNVKNIRRQTESLNDIQDQISDDNELLEAENKLKAKEAALKEKTKLYNMIDEDLQPYFMKINGLLENLQPEFEDYEYKMRLSCFYLSYIKRKSNLLILSRQNDRIDIRELYLSINEIFNEISGIGIISHVSCNGNCEIKADGLIKVFQIVEEAIEASLESLESALLNINCVNNAVDVRLQLSTEISDLELNNTKFIFDNCIIVIDKSNEDNVIYLNISYREDNICH